MPQQLARSPLRMSRAHTRRDVRNELSVTVNAALPTPIRRAMTWMQFEGGLSRLGRGTRAYPKAARTPSTALEFEGTDRCLGRRPKLG